jgi:hypothetical protein
MLYFLFNWKFIIFVVMFLLNYFIIYWNISNLLNIILETNNF